MDSLNNKHATLQKEKLRFATILAFIGMLRPHTFPQLKLQSFTLVMREELLVPLCSQPWVGLGRRPILGFYISFTSKTMADAKAYYPQVSSPVNALLALVKKQAIKKGFLATLGRGSTLEKYLQRITDNPTPISPYALRIGGRT